MVKKLKQNFFKNNKGFIGSVGDDLPSIIPIVIALLLFFSVFSSTLTTYNNRNAEFRQRIETISIARELKGNSLLLGSAVFEDSCKFAKIRPRAYSFLAAVYPANHPVGEIFAYTDEDAGNFVAFNEEGVLKGSITNAFSDEYLLDPADLDYICSYISVGSKEFSGKEKNYIIRFYPVAVQMKDPNGSTIIVPAIMAMVIW
jgi:hypothetical protein